MRRSPTDSSHAIWRTTTSDAPWLRPKLDGIVCLVHGRLEVGSGYLSKRPERGAGDNTAVPEAETGIPRRHCSQCLPPRYHVACKRWLVGDPPAELRAVSTLSVKQQSACGFHNELVRTWHSGEGHKRPSEMAVCGSAPGRQVGTGARSSRVVSPSMQVSPSTAAHRYPALSHAR